MERVTVRIKSGGVAKNRHSEAGCMAHQIREHGEVQVNVVGAGAGWNVLKDMAIATGYLAPEGITVSLKAFFLDAKDIDKTGLKLIISKDK